MTETPRFARSEDVLPGLETPTAGESPLKLAARRTIVQLEATGLLDDRHAVVCQELLNLADDLSVARRGSKAYAIAQLSAQLLAAYQLLMPDAGGGGEGDEWTELVAELRRSSTKARDAADVRSPE